MNLIKILFITALAVSLNIISSECGQYGSYGDTSRQPNVYGFYDTPGYYGADGQYVPGSSTDAKGNPAIRR